MGILDRRCRTQEQVTWNRDASCWSWPLAESGDVSRPCGGRYQCQDVTEGQFCGNVHLDDLDPDYQPQFPRRIVHKDGKVETFESDRIAANTYTFCSDSIWDTEEMRNNGDFNYGLTNFNSLPNAIIVVFQCITLEGWTDIMYLAQDAHNDYFAYIYFLALTFVGSFFLINVALAVVWEAFSELNAEALEEELEKEKELADEADEAGLAPPLATAGAVMALSHKDAADQHRAEHEAAKKA